MSCTPPPRRLLGALCLLVLALLPMLCASRGDPPKPHPQVQALLDKGNEARAASRSEDALRLFNEALESSRTLKDGAGEASALFSLGSVYHATGQPQKALELYQQALPVFRQVGHLLGEASTLTNIELVYRAIRQPQKALEFLEQALPLRRQAGDKAGEANALNNIGNIYLATDQPRKALELYQKALPLFRQAGELTGEANTLNNIGLVYRATGQPQKALEFLGRALPLYGQVGDKASEALTLTGIGNVYHVTGQFQKVLESYQQALLLFKQVGNTAGEAGTLTNIGLVYRATGQPQKALEFYEQALLLHRQVGHKAGEASALTNIGLVYRDTGKPQKALEFFEQALPLHRHMSDKASEAKTLSGIGNIYDATGQPRKALESYQQSLTLFRQAGDRTGEASALANMGLVYHATGQFQKALESYQQALPVFRQVGDTMNEAKALTSLALVQEQRGRLVEAERHLKDATGLLESVRGKLGGLSEAKVGFLTSKLGTYYRYIQVLLKRNKPAEAFAVVQKTKARALLDLMASGRVDIGRQLTGAEKQQEQELRGHAAQLNAQMAKEGVQNEVGAKKRFAALKVQLAQAESDLQTFTDTLYARHPDLARKRAAKTATLADVAKFLPADTALLEYVVLKADVGKNAVNHTVLFVATMEKGKPVVSAFTLRTPRVGLAKRVDDFRAACTDPAKSYRFQARDLYQLLLAPVAPLLATKKRLVVCPDGPLWDVPFQALHDDKKFLLERFELAYAYSATGEQATLRAKNRPRARPAGGLLALGNPDFGNEKRFGDNPDVPGQRPIPTPSRPIDSPSRPIDTPSRPIDTPSRDLFLPRGGRLLSLPGTQQEVDVLKQQFPDAAVYTQDKAQETVVKTEAGKYRFLHLASHAFSNDAAPLLSSIVLANPPTGSGEDGFLTAREIFDLNLSATDMVVLSACNTARGEQRSGEGIVGLTWALFVAGAPTQVLSQWAVDDASTATLMQRFYAGLSQNKAGKISKGNRAGKGAALRAAALSLRRDGRHAHPYYWAPFILVGDWK